MINNKRHDMIHDVMDFHHLWKSRCHLPHVLLHICCILAAMRRSWRWDHGGKKRRAGVIVGWVRIAWRKRDSQQAKDLYNRQVVEWYSRRSVDTDFLISKQATARKLLLLLELFSFDMVIWETKCDMAKSCAFATALKRLVVLQRWVHVLVSWFLTAQVAVDGH